MSISHLGLTVSNIPRSTSFYLATLQPLGYKYFGTRGDSIGLGVHDASFFLTQEPDRYRLAPTHIAFNAVNRATVRQCYAAALDAGGYSSGSPNYREDDCSCFNAAVEDPDGNTVEFIFRDVSDRGSGQPRPTPVRSQTYREQDTQPRSGNLQRSRTEPVDNSASRSLFGAFLGVAAGAAVTYAIVRSERNGERHETRYSSYSEWQEEPRKRSASTSRHRDMSARVPIMRTIEAKPYGEDEDISYVRTRVTRQSQGQSRAVEAIEYGPSRSSTRRSTTMPIAQLEYEPSRYSSRRRSVSEARSRRDSVVSKSIQDKSQRSYQDESREKPRSSTSQVSTVRPIKKDSTYYAAQVPLPPSIVSKASRATKSSSRFDAYYLPSQDSAEDSDGLGDAQTIVPDDSISCIGSSQGSRRRKDPKVEKPSSLMTLTLRPVREGRTRTRTAYSNA